MDFVNRSLLLVLGGLALSVVGSALGIEWLFSVYFLFALCYMGAMAIWLAIKMTS